MQLPLAHHQLEKLKAAFPNQCRVSTAHCPKLSLSTEKKAQLPDTQHQVATSQPSGKCVRLPAVDVAGRMPSRGEKYVPLELYKLQQG